MVLREKWPVIGRHEQAAVWLQIWTDLGRAPRMIDAYARGLAEYLLMCEREDVDPVTANRAHVAVYVRELSSRPHHRGANVVAIDSGAGLANATIQQRLVPVRLFYDFLFSHSAGRLPGATSSTRAEGVPQTAHGGVITIGWFIWAWTRASRLRSAAAACLSSPVRWRTRSRQNSTASQSSTR